MSTLKFDQWLNSSGTENYKCRAWVNFNGTGTVAIRASGNVSSITDNGVGDYTVNFTVALADANYGVSSFPGSSTLTANGYISNGAVLTANSSRINGTRNSAGVLADSDTNSVAFFR